MTGIDGDYNSNTYTLAAPTKSANPLTKRLAQNEKPKAAQPQAAPTTPKASPAPQNTDLETLLSAEDSIPIIPHRNPLDSNSGFDSPISEIKRLRDKKVIGYINLETIYNRKGEPVGRVYGQLSQTASAEIRSLKGKTIGYLKNDTLLNLGKKPIASFNFLALVKATPDTVFAKITNGKIASIAGDPLEYFWQIKGMVKPPYFPPSSSKIPEKRIVALQGEYTMTHRGSADALATYQVGACVVASFFDPVSGLGILTHFDGYHLQGTKESIAIILNHFASQRIPLSRLKVQLAGGDKHYLSSRKIIYTLISEASQKGLKIERGVLFPAGGVLHSIWLDLSDGNLKYSDEELQLDQTDKDYFHKNWELIEKSKTLFPHPAILQNISIEDRIQALLKQIKETESGHAIVKLKKLRGGPAHLRRIIQEGTFMQFYLSARALAESPLFEAEIVILQMIKHGVAPWERALGLILLGSRVAAGRKVVVDALTVIKPFLSEPSPLLQLGAIIALLRMGTNEAKRELKLFSDKNKGMPVAQMIGAFYAYKKSFSYMQYIIFDWADPGTMQTAFFRLPDLLDELAKDLRSSSFPEYKIWDVGCASGLSTESLHIIMNLNKKANTKIHVAGTDINPFAFLYAARGSYLLEGRSQADHYVCPPNVNELQDFKTYAKRHQWDPDKVLAQFFKRETGSLGPLYSARRKESEIEFYFDDVASPSSYIPDRSVDAVVYTNVHYILKGKERPRAIQKIYRKLRPGGKLFFFDNNVETLSDLEVVFGKPVKILGDLRIYIKK